MSGNKKKICFYSSLNAGHLNVCASLGTLLLNRHSDRLEVFFIADDEWKCKLERRDSRFKFGIFEMDKEASAKRMSHVISGLEKALTMCSFDRMAYAQKLVSADPFKSQIDRESEKRIRQISPDFILADHALHMPAMLNTGIPYGFVQSCNPLAFDLEEFPILGSDCRTDDKEAIRECRKRYAELHRPEVMRNYENILKERGAEYRGAMRVNQMISEQHFSVYCFPEPLDYFDEETKRRYNLWQIDSPLFEERIPKPYELPEEFKQIPLPLIFVSLGTMFSAYAYLLQRLLDMLEKLPYKYLVSKGRNGDQVRLPSERFIGSNFVDQLAALQVCEAAICHGGNNTNVECFHFGVPALILPIIWDQINNGVRIEETGWGYQLDILHFTEEQLRDRLERIVNDQELRLRYKKASEKIRADDKITKVADRIAGYVCGLQSMKS